MEGELALEVGLLERGEDPAGVRYLELGVEVDELVDGVDEAVQALAAVAVRAVGDDGQLVVRPQVRRVRSGCRRTPRGRAGCR